jgi:hypothetical protein
MARKLLLSDGSEFKVDGKNVFEAVYSGTIKQVDVERRRMTMVGTDESTDRDGDIIRMRGWHLENYRKNPVFLWAHNYSSVPIGRTEKLVKRQNPIRMEHHLVYPTKGLHPFADMILQLYAERFINASSVGFIPNKWNPMERPKEQEENIRRTWGREYIDQELLELSGCAVPSNPNALQDALKGKSFTNIPFEEVQKWLLGQASPPKPKNADDIMQELMGKVVELKDETDPKIHQVPESFLCAVEEENDPPAPEEVFTDGEKIELDEVEKPYANEHACRLADPAQFDSFARKNCNAKHDGKCIDFIFGIKAGKSTLQAMRYPKASWTAAAAKTHCGGHSGSFESAKEQDTDEITIASIYDKVTEIDTKILAFMAEMKVMIVQALKVPEESIITYTGTDLANQSNDQGSDGEGKGKKGAGEAILDEAFSKGKPQTVEPAIPAPVQNFTGVITALKELRKSIDPKKED